MREKLLNGTLAAAVPTLPVSDPLDLSIQCRKVGGNRRFFELLGNFAWSSFIELS